MKSYKPVLTFAVILLLAGGITLFAQQNDLPRVSVISSDIKGTIPNQVNVKLKFEFINNALAQTRFIEIVSGSHDAYWKQAYLIISRGEKRFIMIDNESFEVLNNKAVFEILIDKDLYNGIPSFLVNLLDEKNNKLSSISISRN
jgi:hypothetical protein